VSVNSGRDTLFLNVAFVVFAILLFCNILQCCCNSGDACLRWSRTTTLLGLVARQRWAAFDQAAINVRTDRAIAMMSMCLRREMRTLYRELFANQEISFHRSSRPARDYFHQP